MKEEQPQKKVFSMQAGDSGYVKPSEIVKIKPLKGSLADFAVVQSEPSSEYCIYIKMLDDGELIVTCSLQDETCFRAGKPSKGVPVTLQVSG